MVCVIYKTGGTFLRSWLAASSSFNFSLYSCRWADERNKWMTGQMNGWINGWINGWWLDEWMDEWMDGWLDW